MPSLSSSCSVPKDFHLTQSHAKSIIDTWYFKDFYSMLFLKKTQAGGQRGILPTIKDLWRSEGIRRGFFKGMLYPIISNGAINSIFFGVYGSLLPRLQVVEKLQDWCKKNLVADRSEGWCWLPQRLFGWHCWRCCPAWSRLPRRTCQGDFWI